MTVADAGPARSAVPAAPGKPAPGAPVPGAPVSRAPASPGTSRGSRRPGRRWAVVVLVVVVLAVGGVVARAAWAPAAPSVWMTGLPQQVVAGTTFAPQVHVRFPDRWPEDDHGSVRVDRASVGVTARAVLSTEPWAGEEGESILCSTGIVHATSEYVGLDCEMTAPSPGPWVVTVHVTAHGDPAWDTQTRFTHLVVAP